MTNPQYPQLITHGLSYLAQAQQADGSFLSLSTRHPRTFRSAVTYPAVFPTALILSTLNSLDPSPSLTPIKNKAAAFLLTQKSRQWSFNYWARQAPEQKLHPYPDDLDDTFCALAALHRFQPSLFNGRVLAKITTLLTTLEVDEGGPYRTWLVPESAAPVWRDVDLAVNANIASFLSLEDVTLNSLTSLIETAIQKNEYISPYYPSPYPVIYFISRSYRGRLSKSLWLYLSSLRRESHWSNPLVSALAVTAALNLHVSPQELKPTIPYLISHFSSPPPAYPFCHDPSVKGQPTYAGSPALTTAFILEALTKYHQTITIHAVPSSSLDTLRHQIITIVRQRLAKHRQARPILTRLLSTDLTQPIVLLPTLFSRALPDRYRHQLSPTLLKNLGSANLYGWLAYTIYDDFLDDEGKPPLLPLANICLRSLTDIFTHCLPHSPGFTRYFHSTMDRLDAANTWEVTHCRFDPQLLFNNPRAIKLPDYGTYTSLADRSLGHMLGIAALLFSLGFTASSPEIKQTERFFRHYLIARQLNDDAHDWEADLKVGHLNAAGTLLLQQLGPTLPTNTTALPKHFWLHTITPLCRCIQRHLNQAERISSQLTYLKDKTILIKLLNPIRTATDQAEREQKRTLTFIQSI